MSDEEKVELLAKTLELVRVELVNRAKTENERLLAVDRLCFKALTDTGTLSL